MDHTKEWIEKIRPMLDRQFGEYDPAKHHSLKYVFEIGGTSNGPGFFRMPEPLLNEDSKNIIYKVLLETLPSRLNGLNPNDTELQLDWV
jgi:hypothetical protein